MPITRLDKRYVHGPRPFEIAQNTEARDVPKILTNRKYFNLLNTLIDKMNSSQMVTEREICTAVLPDEWGRYEDKKRPAKRPKMPPNIWQQFSPYQALLRCADRRFDEAENSAASNRGRKKNLPDYQNPYRLAERDYAHALEILEKLLQCDPGVVAYLDRPVSFDLNAMHRVPIRLACRASSLHVRPIGFKTVNTGYRTENCGTRRS